MSYELVLDPSGDYLSSSGETYKGCFKNNHLNLIEKAALMSAAKNRINAYFILDDKVAQKCVASFDGESRLIVLLDNEESKS